MRRWMLLGLAVGALLSLPSCQAISDAQEIREKLQEAEARDAAEARLAAVESKLRTAEEGLRASIESNEELQRRISETKEILSSVPLPASVKRQLQLE